MYPLLMCWTMGPWLLGVVAGGVCFLSSNSGFCLVQTAAAEEIAKMKNDVVVFNCRRVRVRVRGLCYVQLLALKIQWVHAF